MAERELDKITVGELTDEEPRCVLCGVLESDQDFDFDEYKEVDGVVYMCLICLETY